MILFDTLYIKKPEEDVALFTAWHLSERSGKQHRKFPSGHLQHVSAFRRYFDLSKITSIIFTCNVAFLPCGVATYLNDKMKMKKI